MGSYVERALADAIVNDIVPALIHVAEASLSRWGLLVLMMLWMCLSDVCG